MVLRHPRFRNNLRLQRAAENSPALKPGDPDELAVSIVQRALVDLGYAMPRSTNDDGRLDGDYGNETVTAIRSFQRDQGLQVDGKAGRDTMRRLDQVAPAISSSLPEPTPSPPDPLIREPDDSNAGPSVLLSFDDGPAPVTALISILNTLAANDIQADFYLLGKEVAQHRHETRRIVAAGHKAQNHSWSHPNLARLSEVRVRSELQRTQLAIQEASGFTPTKIRPPYGAGGWAGNYDREIVRVARQLNLAIHNWDIDTEDWRRPAGLGAARLQAIKRQLKNHPRQTALDVLMHVSHATARDLPNFIVQLKRWGYGFARP
ncbi:MAG: polysaccharide deacetylase family protein [Thiolinea sp.]